MGVSCVFPNPHCYCIYVTFNRLRLMVELLIWDEASLKVLNRRIDSVLGARDRAKTEWAQLYWDTVLAYLLRQANRLN